MLELGGGGMGMPIADMTSASTMPSPSPRPAADYPEQYAFGNDQSEYLAATVAESHHCAELSRSLENAHVHAVGNTQQDHDQDDQLQKTELPFIQLYGFLIKIIQLDPGLDLQAGRPSCSFSQAATRSVSSVFFSEMTSAFTPVCRAIPGLQRVGFLLLAHHNRLENS